MRTRAELVGTVVWAAALGASAALVGATASAAPDDDPAATIVAVTDVTTTSSATTPAPTTAATTTAAPTTTDPWARGAPIDDLTRGGRGTTTQLAPPPPPPTTTTTTTTAPPPPAPWALPPGSGSGRRAVYSKSAQRVWAVDGAGRVVKTHRVSGKLKWCDPRPGHYSVFSRSRTTYAIQNPSITWGFMIRFTKGCNGGNIGFHEIPFQYGRPVQSIAQLGQPLSGGCVRQARSDAIWMWNWAGVGTRVVVTP